MTATTDAYYMKLGTSGKWAEESITRGIARIVWPGSPSA